LSAAGACRWSRPIFDAGSAATNGYAMVTLDTAGRPYACVWFVDGTAVIAGSTHNLPNGYRGLAVVGFEGDSGGAVWSSLLSASLSIHPVLFTISLSSDQVPS
jgi:hypothetical protein